MHQAYSPTSGKTQLCSQADSFGIDSDETLKSNLKEKELSRMFENAADYVQQKTGELDTDTLMYLYARFKQSKQGPCNVSKPRFLDFKGCKKWTAWKALGEMSTEISMRSYISKVGEIDPKWLEENASDRTPQKNIGPVMSTLADTDTFVPDHEKTLFDDVKEGNLTKLREMIDKSNVNLCDESGMTLLHWACDRGNVDIVRWLVASGADVNCRDADGQTPLHYASSCGHLNVLVELMANGAWKDQVDAEGQTPKDIAFNCAVRNVFDSSVAKDSSHC